MKWGSATKGQQDKLKIWPQDGKGQGSLSKSRRGPDAGRDGMGWILRGNHTIDVFSSQHHKQFIHFVIELSHLLARQKSWRKFQADISHDRPDTWQGF